MSDVTDAVAQDTIAESLLGPQPTQEESAEQPQAGAEAVDQSEQVQAQETDEQPTEESPEDWLPSDQDKVFPDEVYAKYAQRYQFSPEQATDPLIRQLLHDKINSDIYLRQLQEQEQQQEFAVEEPQQEPTQQQAQQPPTFEEHFNRLNGWVQQNTDPRVANMFASEFMKAFGVNDAVSPQTAQALTRTMSTFGLNLIQTALPQMLAPMLDSVLPGLSSMYYTGSRAQSWDSVRNSSPDYANLPAYGSREFMELCARVNSEFPALTEMGTQLEKANGGELHGKAAEKFYSTLAKVASNLDKSRVDPQQLLEAARAGAASTRRGQVRKDAGNLGSGQSKGLNNNRAVGSKFQTNADIFDDDTMAIWNKEHGRI